MDGRIGEDRFCQIKVSDSVNLKETTHGSKTQISAFTSRSWFPSEDHVPPIAC